jgi:sugar/nucleoside kinase (ribokinase family)
MLTVEQTLAKCFHLICTPARCLDLVKGVLEKRSMTGFSEATDSGTMLTSSESPTKRPLFVWEPVPDSCKPEEFAHMLEALKVVDVLSPNHHELASFFGSSNTTCSSEASELATLRHQCTELLEHGFNKGQGAVIVRRGEQGCYLASSHRQLSLPAYHQPMPKSPAEPRSRWRQKVVDPTGGGNAFLGGFCVGLLDASTEDAYGLEYAALYGSVAASFAIEQIGMPQLSHSDDGQELWNGEAPEDRLKELRMRVLPAHPIVGYDQR